MRSCKRLRDYCCSQLPPVEKWNAMLVTSSHLCSHAVSGSSGPLRFVAAPASGRHRPPPCRIQHARLGTTTARQNGTSAGCSKVAEGAAGCKSRTTLRPTVTGGRRQARASSSFRASAEGLGGNRPCRKLAGEGLDHCLERLFGTPDLPALQRVLFSPRCRGSGDLLSCSSYPHGTP